MESRPIVELQEIPLKGREVRLCFDSDVHKPQVRSALEKLATWLRDQGAHVLIERLPNAMALDPEGDPVRLGLDDLIYRHGAAFFLAIAAAAEPAWVIKGKGDKAEEVFHLPSEPMGPEATFRRALWLYGLIGCEWRVDPESRDGWWMWTGTHWRRVNGNDHLQEQIEVFFARQGWREALTIGSVCSLLAAFRRQLGILKPAAMDGLVPCQNGVLRLSDGALLPHDPGCRNTWALGIPWQPLADPTRIESFLAEALNDPADVVVIRAAIRRMVAGPRWKGFVELTGPPDSAKSVIGNLFTALTGEGGTASIELATLEDRTQRFETLKLRGKRLAIISEAQDYHGKLERIKALTGGDLIRAERKGSNEHVDFYFNGLVLAIGNASIRSTDASAAVLNRRRSVLTPRAVPPGRQRPMLDRTEDGGWTGELAPHLPSLLRWALAMPEAEAAAALGRSAPSPSRIEAELSILLDSDNLAAWADEALIFDPAVFTRTGASDDSRLEFLFPNYRLALKGDEAQPLSAKNFKTRLVGLLRDALDLPLPSGLTSSGAYRVRGLGSVVPCVRFRTAFDGDAPGVIRYAMQLRMCPKEPESPETPVGNGSAESGTAAERQEPSGDTDGMDGTEKSHSARKGEAVEENPLIGGSGPLSVPSVPPAPGQGFGRSAAVPTRSRSVPGRSAEAAAEADGADRAETAESVSRRPATNRQWVEAALKSLNLSPDPEAAGPVWGWIAEHGGEVGRTTVRETLDRLQEEVQMDLLTAHGPPPPPHATDDAPPDRPLAIGDPVLVLIGEPPAWANGYRIALLEGDHHRVVRTNDPADWRILPRKKVRPVSTTSQQ